MTHSELDRPDDRDSDSKTPLQLRGVVHDLRQMLAVITGRAGLLKHKGGSGAWQADLDAIVLAAQDAAAMLDRMQTSSSAVTADVASASVQEAAVSAGTLIQPAMDIPWVVSLPGHDVSPEADGGLWRLEVTVEKTVRAALPNQVLREVFNNLLHNTLAVMPTGGVVRITAHRNGERLQVYVADTGCGVAAEKRHRIFDVGYSETGDMGRGIGLPAIRQLLQAWDASIDIVDKDGPGATFVLDLPVGSVASTQSASQPAPMPALSSHTVLVVDDEAMIRDMLSDILTELGQDVVAAPSAEAALGLFKSGRFQLAFLDLSLPGISGLDLAGLLRDRDSDLVLVLVSGWGSDDILQSAVLDDPQVDLVAHKPLDFDQIRRLLGQGFDLNRMRRDDR